MKPCYISHKNDLYKFTLDDSGDVSIVEVAAGNHCAPWTDVKMEDVPAEVVSKLNDQIVKEFDEIPTIESII